MDDQLLVAGVSPRALLAAVYALLEAVGCRWSPHGSAEEIVPDRASAVAVRDPIEHRPAFARRSYASDLITWHYSMPERLAERLPADVAFIDWMAKAGSTGFLFIRHANDTQWVIPALVPELARRGLAIEGGGHALVELLPRALFRDHPEYFPLGEAGHRSDMGNVCPSSPGALATVRERARAARGAIPGASDLHLWGLDLIGGGWCRCPACRGLSPSEQALSVCNAAAEGLDDGARIFHLAYHDTLPPPHAVRPAAAVWAEFAPRERCYAHPLDAPDCATNARYREALEGHLDRFDGRVHVFEYYGDAILFGGCAVPLVDVIAGDLAYYARAGVGGVSCLTFGRYSLWAYGVNVEAFARGSRSPAWAGAAAAERCRRRYGDAATGMAAYFRALERVTAAAVTHGDVKLPPRRRAAALAEALARALAERPALERLLRDATDGGPGGAVLAAERHLLDYTLATLAGVHAWLAAPDHGAAARAVSALRAAIAHLRPVDPEVAGTWGRYDLELLDAAVAGVLLAEGRPRR
jgi:hypothetical protein